MEGSFTFWQAAILIHTSVKLVTGAVSAITVRFKILIHTSVKLVTTGAEGGGGRQDNFNPHEREARDIHAVSTGGKPVYILIHTSVKLVTHPEADAAPTESILIHTSVKLVTGLTYVGLT